MSKSAGVLLLLLLLVQPLLSQDYRWQQRVEYAMDVRLDTKSHLLTGTQKITYHNNSPDTLTKVYYHLYFNAFQPGSMMDVRSRTIDDPDPRVKDRISKLKEEEIGYQHIRSLKQDGKELNYKAEGTILEVTLTKPILPNSKTVFDMTFEAQVPIQIRRSGRNNKEGIAYSMTQWYPKIAEYDYRGWHAYQYVAREFHSVWGDFDVNITIDPSYIIGGTGILQNPEKIGYSYEKPGSSFKRPAGELTWHFVARNVIDFAWVADPDFVHDKAKVPGGPELHFFYQRGEKTTENWKKLQDIAVKHFDYMNKNFGKYPYESYSIIQGGDGGMEYPMCTLILGERSLGSLAGLMMHEASHSWYQAILASNEALYPWQDEGFADFSSQESMAFIFGTPMTEAHEDSYAGYFNLIKRGLQEPIGQHADHYSTNTAYNTAAYSMGTIFLNQLKYIIGEDTFYRGMKRYYDTWKFHHPEPNDFLRVMEKASGLELKWYLNYWINTTKRIDYGIKNVVKNDDTTLITLERIGEFPMPIDLVITYADGSRDLLYVPTNETLGNKHQEHKEVTQKDLAAWPWVNPTYTLKAKQHAAITSIEIDPSMRMADVDRSNNKINLEGLTPFEDATR